MGSIFSRPKPPPPPPSRLEESIERQENREQQREVNARRRTTSRRRARAAGGMAQLMTGDATARGRDTAATEGLSQTLGAGRNPRG